MKIITRLVARAFRPLRGVFGTHSEFAELTRRLGFEYNGMILHEYYFSNLRRAAEPTPPAGSGLAQALGQSFGSLDQWVKDFHAAR